MIEYSDLKIQCDTIMLDEYKDNIIGWGNVSFFLMTLLIVQVIQLKYINMTIT